MPTAELVRLDSFDAERGHRSFRFGGHVRTLIAGDLAEVAGVLREVESAVGHGLHAVGYLAYEAAPAFDAALVTRPPAPGLPLAWFALFRERLEVDAAAETRVPTEFELGDWTADTAEPAYRAAFTRIRELLAAGDSYQVNHTFRLLARFSGDPLALYEHLCRAQRSAFCAYLDLGRQVVVSASPELFFHRNGDQLTLRPMKGTRPRGRWEHEDRVLAAELVASPKERAENLMIVDLLRNDAGRVALPGSVRVERMFEVEHYQTVHQMTSTIRATIAPQVGTSELFGALFPCGSVTGAPKVRTMEIIAETEATPRGVYCGAIGLVSPGEAVFSVGIRTVVVDREAGSAELGVGSGVTWDANAADEYRECLGKAAFARQPETDFELLETLRYDPGSGFRRLDGHLTRMQSSARRFGFSFDRRTVSCAMHQAVEGAQVPLRIRVVLPRDGVARVQVTPMERAAQAVRVGMARQSVSSRDALLYYKTTRRELYDAARADRPDCDDVLLVNERGEVTESTIANLVVRMGDRLVTPAVECGLLPGVLRAELLERGEIVEAPIRVEELLGAEEVWLISSLRGWRRARVEGLRDAG
jgi:para-aminobenzoate synthetase / 4-amino-4-deoxychorismate lyase